ncbi:MAG: viroplasmin family protein [Deltaproteobacteria bacterium]|nr:viroplasmin family protein [Deltaproteobacteria bacterium]
MAGKRKNRFYAYVTARERGIVSSWAACESKVSGREARYKGFPDRATAELWLASGARYETLARKNRKIYAYHTETGDGIADTWDECERIVQGRRARYRGFDDREAARKWLEAGAWYEDRETEKREALSKYPEDSVFFDSGTGPGRGTEIRVTDRSGITIIHIADHDEGRLVPEGNIVLGHARTNNYGELLACLLGIQAATRLGSKHVYGDSKLVLDYWSRGRVSKDKRAGDPDLAVLAARTKKARARFEKDGGTLDRISGALNPADLGFHRD